MYIFRGHRLIFFYKNGIISLKINFDLANSVDPDEMLYFVAFHLGLHCFPKYLFNQTTKG